jgi:hypothetical protein
MTISVAGAAGVAGGGGGAAEVEVEHASAATNAAITQGFLPMAAVYTSTR